MRFLTGSNIQAQVRSIASRSGPIMAAVAYWGKGAAELTGLCKRDDPASVRIICDLLSGACNPTEIERLKDQDFSVKTLDRLHAKVWISGDEVIVGSANASHNGLPGDYEEAANASIEAAVLMRNSRLARKLSAWFEEQWCASSEIEEHHLEQAREMWRRRHRAGGRGFTTPLTEKIQSPDPVDRFADLRLLAFLAEDVSPKAEEFINENRGRYFTDEEWNEFGNEKPWYEEPHDSEWAPPSGTVYANFTCRSKGGKFSFDGFWKIQDCPNIELEDIRLILLTKLPNFNGYSLSAGEQKVIARRIREVMEDGSYIDKSFLEFWDAERTELRKRLLDQVVQAARELCRSDQFTPALTLHAIRACMEDPEWLADYGRFVGGGIYGDRNPLKRRINPYFGSRVKAAVGAKDQEDENGKPVIMKFVENEIIQSCTLFADYDPRAVETS